MGIAISVKETEGCIVKPPENWSSSRFPFILRTINAPATIENSTNIDTIATTILENPPSSSTSEAVCLLASCGKASFKSETPSLSESMQPFLSVYDVPLSLGQSSSESMNPSPSLSHSDSEQPILFADSLDGVDWHWSIESLIPSPSESSWESAQPFSSTFKSLSVSEQSSSASGHWSELSFTPSLSLSSRQPSWLSSKPVAFS